jgi:hypothetical protein
VLLLGSAKICLFPSNPLIKLPEGTKAKNNHGNFSDLIALGMIVDAGLCIFYPEHLFQDIGPMKAQFTSKSADLSAMIELIGCLMLVIALIFSGVKWNPINGKMSGFGGLVIGGYTAYFTFKADSNAFVLRIFYAYAIKLLLGSIHILFFPSNPLPPKKDKKDKKDK